MIHIGIIGAGGIGFDIAEYISSSGISPTLNLNKWMKKMYSQPGISKGLDVPFKVEKLLDDEGKVKEFSKNASKMVKK